MFPQLPAAVRVFLCTQPTDMRKGYDSLALLAQASSNGDSAFSEFVVRH